MGALTCKLSPSYLLPDADVVFHKKAVYHARSQFRSIGGV